MGKLDSSNKSSAIPEEIIENIVWQEIRKGLIEELGEAIDTVWFAKVIAKECNETNTLTLTMPTRFMADYIRNRYGYAISRISGTFGFKYIEYNH
jgi:chromosomal replication initiation ATPase DnaA